VQKFFFSICKAFHTHSRSKSWQDGSAVQSLEILHDGSAVQSLESATEASVIVLSVRLLSLSPFLL
jgi:predicted nucleic acid-binding protein